MKKDRIAELHYFEWRLTAWALSETRDRLNAAGRGIYRELLDQCYGQGRFPDDPEWICRRCACSLEEYQTAWNFIKKHFPVSKTAGYRHHIPADIVRREYFSYVMGQRKNRKQAIVKAKELREIEKLALSSPQPNGNDTATATTTATITASKTLPRPEYVGPRLLAADLNGQTSQRFEEFWSRYPKQTWRDSAARDWCSVVTVDAESAVFACLENYLASAEVARRAIMDAGSDERKLGWIMKCHREHWECRWPPVSEPSHKLTPTERVALQWEKDHPEGV
jgi:hypothetical protein